MITMNEKKVQNFTSYINSPVNNAEKNGSIQEVKPKLLNGEIVVSAVHNVLMLIPLSDSRRSGSLFVTNYKLSFVPYEPTQHDECGQRNYLLGPHDVPLTGVGALWMTEGGLVRRRRLLPHGDMPQKVKGLQVICKNMKVLTFSFANSSVGNGRKIALTLLHHAFPKRHHLLFAYEYKEPYYRTLPTDLNMFDRTTDWKKELERCDCPHWRITLINGTTDAFMLSGPPTLIVPMSLLDCKLLEYARHYKSGRIPIWVWGRPEGAALLRSGELLPTDQAMKIESVLLEQVRKSHPTLVPLNVIYLCGNSYSNTVGPNTLPPLATLQSSYKKLVDLCTPTTLSSFWEQDSKYYLILESSRWLRYVANCLAFADEAAEYLAKNVTVVLLEGEGVDYCAVVSSLTQLLVDPHYRTISGFQSLIQKEWIALGHPFCDRFGLPRPGASDIPDSGRGGARGEAGGRDTAQTAPVFLLFLDCVWQLLQQFPSHFQFTETYLTTLWDCTHNHVFDTFLFNCPRDRDPGITKNFIQRPVWDWSEQFSDQDKALFYNPLYGVCNFMPTPKQRLSMSAMAAANASKQAGSGRGAGGPELQRLRPAAGAGAGGVELWAQCYERWLPPLDALHAGPVQRHVRHYALRDQIQRLSEKLSSLSILSNRQSNGSEVEPVRLQPVSRFYPFSQYRTEAVAGTLDAMQVSLIDASQLIDSQSLLNAPD
ncbi:myotubularin-related protein 10-A [Galleria mellonella]|uniref:Myotubularin-related protein 10-A n=1 Tax=Galleria mellonella TaxID=7137 RepID=A0ABM3MLS2_GALME|nr:myotubularin-related protein 10-A [Galleria mellonella]